MPYSGPLDKDSSGSLELAELLSIVDSGVTHSFSTGQSIVVGEHPQDRFNGTYSQQEGTMNGKPFFKNQSDACSTLSHLALVPHHGTSMIEIRMVATTGIGAGLEHRPMVRYL